jgi:serine/threonine-protein kinase
VVPFSNTSGNTDDTPFTDGLTDELISVLGKVRGLRVTARTTAFALRGKGLDARAMANMIGVAHLLEGSVRRDGDRLKVTAQLVSASEGTVTWAETYDREVRDIFAVQEELARAIVEALAPALGLGDAPATHRARDVATYELFLKGRYFWEKRTPPDLKRAVEYFERAAARDPTYAEAYAGVADSLTLLVVFGGQRPADELPRLRAALAEALRLGRDSAMVHATNGNVLSAIEWRWAEAESESRIAIELDPGLINARVYLAILLQHLGRCEEAIEVAQRALAVDPLSPALNLTLGRALLHAHRPAEALGPLRTSVEIAPGFAFAQTQLGHALLQLDRGGDAMEAFRRGAASGGPNEKGQLAYALASTGDPPAARDVLGELLELESRGYLPPFGVACAYTGLGDGDAAFAWLQRGFSERAAQMNTIKVAPALAALHGDRRWGDLLARMDLAPSQGRPG